MTTEMKKRLAAVRAELDRQNEAWQEALRAIERLGQRSIATPHEFVQRLDTLAPTKRHPGLHD
jgi:hypothetical protein